MTTGVVMRRRATSGEMARGGLVFVFFLGVAPVSEGDSFTPSGEDGTRGLVFLFGGCSGVGGEFFHTLGSGWHEGGWFLFFLWGLLRCRCVC